MRSDIDFEYSGISQVLTELQSADRVPLGAQGKIFNALDRLRAARAPRDRIDAVEKISVSIHRWELALRRRDVPGEQSVREQLNSLATNWIEIQ